MIIFLIIEASRIMWAWITVQNAARSGARYAITGLFDPGCATNGIPKYQYLCDESNPSLAKDPNFRRPASIVREAHDALSGIKLDENGTLTDEYGYEIFVWGVDDEEIGGVANFWRGSYMDPPRGPEPYGGKPNLPVAVRVIYYVPIITPFFRPIRESIPVYGQTVLYNEPFDQLGGTGRSAGVPPPIPTLPTPGVTPTFTPTPTPGNTPTPSQTPTDTPIPTPLPCAVRFTSSLVANSTFASVTGLWWDYDNDQNHVVTFYDITTGRDPDVPGPDPLVILGTAVMVEETGGNQACPGVGDTAPPNQLSSPLVAGHLIKAVNTDGSSAVGQVQQGTDTPTPTNTSTPLPTFTPAPTFTPIPSATPLNPYVDILQSCLAAGTGRQINVIGANNWPLHTISIYYDGVLLDRILYPGEHSGNFSQTYTVDVTTGTHIVEARAANGYSDTDTLVSPCPNITPTATTTAVTATPRPADLVIIGQPAMISTPPIVEYKPVQFQVVISNTGQVDVDEQFFVDIYFDPDEVYSTVIPLNFSDGYLAVGSLAGGASKVITITSPIGFTGGESQRIVYGMVDSLEIIAETDETNNVSGGLDVVVTPAPVPSGTPQGSINNTISGLVRGFVGSWVPQRAFVWIQDEGDPTIIFGPIDALNGIYSFQRVPDGTYTVIACQFREDGQDYVGQRPAISPPNLTANVFMLIDPSGCPLP